ncbi:MAG TPA: DNA replication/repair protein RecF [Chloroflexota bacterium]|nr:DNA replication/repair protein RecF [Chloroflexota bacterium]
MILTRLRLQHYRNYGQLDLGLNPGPTILYGPNGAGKTNILEAVFTLATTKSFRARSDRDVIGRHQEAAPYRLLRLEGDIEHEDERLVVELVVTAEPSGREGVEQLRKRFRLNGAPKRAVDVVGRVKAVLFAPSDADIVAGSPSHRRRYLDLLLCQVDPGYLRLLQQYTRIVQRRNAVLGRLAPRSHPGILEFWDQKLIEDGSAIIRRRVQAIQDLAEAAAEAYAGLSGGSEALSVGYLPSLGTVDGESAVEERFRARLTEEEKRGREQRVTLVGPHRDELALEIEGEPLAVFGSRGQQRTAALALRIAEARYILSRSGRHPILLLDEALAELDDDRRERLLAFVEAFPQVLLTGTSLAAFPAEFRQRAALLRVHSGEISSD